MEGLINGYVPTELMIGGQVINGCAKGGEVVYRKKNAGYITNYGDDFITTNDTVYAQIKNLNIYGKTQQDQYYIETVEDSVVQFDDAVGEYATVEVKANENLLLGTKDFSEFTSSDYVYVDTDGFSIFETPNGSTTYNFNNVKLNYGQNYVLSFYIKGTTTTSQARELIQWFDESGTRISYSWITYAVSEEFEFTNKIITPYSEEACYLKVGLRSSVGINSYKKLKLEEITDINPDGTPTPWIPNVDDGVDMPSFEVTRCGKNLFDINTGIEFAMNCTYVVDGENLVMTAAGTDMYVNQIASLGRNYNPIIAGALYPNNADYYLTLSNTEISSNYVTFYDEYLVSLGYQRFTTGQIPTIANAKYISLRFGMIPATIGETYSTTILLTVGNDTDYEPYTGETYTLTVNTPTQIPLLDGINTFFADSVDNLTVRYLTETETDETTPNADFPQEMTSVEGDLVVKSVGKNLLDNTLIFSTGASYYAHVVGKTFIKAGTTVIITRNYTDNKYNRNNAIMKFNNSSWSRYENNIGFNAISIVRTIEDDGYYGIGFVDDIYSENGWSAFGYVQMQIGTSTSEFTDYEPYTGSAATLTLTESLKGIETSTNYNYIDSDGQTWLNDVLDVQNSEIKKNLAEIVFDGTENWEATSDSFIRMNYILDAKPVTDNNTIAPLFCNLYHNKTANQTYLGEEGVSIDTSGNLKIYSADFTDVISWKAYLAGLYANNTPLRIIYQLNTPTTEQIDTTSLKKLRSYVGQTNLFVDNNAGVQADFRVNYGELITITDNLIQFDNGFTGSYISVTADEDCEVTRCGKNLFDGLEELGGYYDATGEPYATSSIYRSINYISVPQSQTLAISTSLNIYEYNSNREFIQKNSRQYSPITLSNNTTKIRISKGLSISAVQLEVGTIATDYEEYQGETHTLTAGETVKIPVLNGTNTLFTNSATATLTANYYTYSDNTYAYSNALNELGVNSANTTDQMINQLEDMGVEI